MNKDEIPNKQIGRPKSRAHPFHVILIINPHSAPARHYNLLRTMSVGDGSSRGGERVKAQTNIVPEKDSKFGRKMTGPLFQQEKGFVALLFHCNSSWNSLGASVLRNSTSLA